MTQRAASSLAGVDVPAYERKARALLSLDRLAEAVAAVRRGLVLDPEHEALLELEERAARDAAAARLDIVRAGKEQIDRREQARGGTEPPPRLR